MAISPAEIRALQFNTVKRGGYDQREVESFRTAAADSLESALQESTAMEARARAAVARLQEMSHQQAAAPAAEPVAEEAAVEPAEAAPVTEAAPPPRVIAVDEAETISRTLLLAQRTADSAIAAAEAEAAQIVENARAESRRAGEAERVRVEGEVQSLLARRDFLESDVDQLEQHLQAQRERIAEVAAELGSLTNGLAPMRRPQLSASDHSGEVAIDESVAIDEGDDDVDVSSLIDQARVAGDTTSPVDRPVVDDPDHGHDEGHEGHDLFSQDDH